MVTEQLENIQTQPDRIMLSELRNYHVKKLLNHLGGKDVPPYLQKSIKRAFSELIEDIEKQTAGDKYHDTETNGNTNLQD